MVQHLTDAYERGYVTGRRVAEEMIWQGTLSDRLLKDPGYRYGQDYHTAYKQGFLQALEDSADRAAKSRDGQGGLRRAPPAESVE